MAIAQRSAAQRESRAGQRARRTKSDLLIQLRWVVFVVVQEERWKSDEQRVHNHAERPRVRGGASDASRQDLGGNEQRRPSAPAGGYATSDSKVSETDAAIRREEDIRGLHIEMRDAERVHMCERGGELQQPQR